MQLGQDLDDIMMMNASITLVSQMLQVKVHPHLISLTSLMHISRNSFFYNFLKFNSIHGKDDPSLWYFKSNFSVISKHKYLEDNVYVREDSAVTICSPTHQVHLRCIPKIEEESRQKGLLMDKSSPKKEISIIKLSQPWIESPQFYQHFNHRLF